MTDPATVNPQITDAVVQANTKLVGDAAALSMGTIYQSLAHATGILYENAVAAQQEQNTAAQAATVQGVSLLYGLDTATTGVATTEALQAQTRKSADALKMAVAAGSVSPQIEQSVRTTLDAVLGNAGAFAYALRVSTDAMSAAIDEAGKLSHQNLLRILQLAATAACLDAMIKSPDKADAYAPVLESIKHLV